MTRNLSNLSIGNKILLGFFSLILLYLVIGLQGYSDMKEISALAERVVPLSSQISSWQEFAISLESMDSHIENFFLVNYIEDQEEANKDLEKMHSIIRSLDKNADSNSSAKLQEMDRLLSEIQINFNYLANLKQNNINSREINEKRYLVYVLINSGRQKQHEFLSETTDQIQVNVLNQQRVISNLIRDFLIIGASILVVGMIISFLTSRSISQPIEKLRAATTEIGHGNLNVNIGIQSNDEVGELASAFNIMTEELKKKTVSKEYVDNIIGSMFNSLIVFSPDGTIQSVNRATCSLLGYRAEELVGQPIDIVLTNEASHSESSWLDKIIKRVSVSSTEKTFIAKDGRKIPVLFSGSVMRYENGNIQGIVCVAQDITERKQMDEELKKHREHLEDMVKVRTHELNISREKEHAAALYARNLIETSLDPLVTISKDGTITDVNRATEFVTGFSSDQLIGSDFSDYFTEPEKAKEGYNLVFIQGFVRDYPLAIRHTSGKITDVLYNATVYRNEAGEVQGVFAVARDVTERKRVEESIRLAKEEAERANMAKTNFLHTISHELRTPLNAILGFSEMLKLKTSGKLNEKQGRFIDNIITGGNNLHNIISQILDVVTVYDRMLELLIQKISVPETLDEVIGVIKEKAVKKNVTIEKYLDPELEYIEADKQKFKQIFINLLDNAVKFSKRDSRTVTINAKKEGDMAKFSVSDRGIGIKEEDIERIFHNFSQLDSGTNRKYGGIGIGLALTKQLVELHGGKIWAESKYGEGTTIIFTLPLGIKNR